MCNFDKYLCFTFKYSSIFMTECDEVLYYCIVYFILICALYFFMF